MNWLEHTKECYKCKVIKPIDEYYKDKTKEDGLNITCKKCKKAYKKAQYEKNKDRIKKRNQAWRQENADKVSEASKAYYRENREDRMEYSKSYQKKRYSEDPDFRWRKLISNHAWRFFQGMSEDPGVIGCSLEEAKANLASKAPKGFTWADYSSKFHIDHRIPLSAFDLTDEAQREAAGHISNLQILTEEQNRSKGDKLPEGFNLEEYLENFQKNEII